MDLKKIIVYCMEIVLGGILFLFCLTSFFGIEIGGEKGVFQIVGKTSVYNDYEAPDSDSKQILNDIQTTGAPEVKFSGRVFTVNEYIKLKEELSVKLPGGTDYIDGELESGFTIYILNVLDDEGSSILTDPSVSYNEAESGVTFSAVGVYRVPIKVIGTNGRFVETTLRLMVEDEAPVPGTP